MINAMVEGVGARLKTSLLLVVLLGFLGIAGCDAPMGRSPVLMVDLDAVARALGRDDVIAQQINNANTQLNTQVVQIAQNLQEQLKDQQDRLGEEPDEEDMTLLQERVAEANRQLEETQQLARTRSAQFRQVVIAQFRGEVQPVAMELAKERGAKMVITAATPMLWFDQAVDITDEVIAEMRARGLERIPETPDADASDAESPAANSSE